MKYNTPYFVEDKSFLTVDQKNYISNIFQNMITPFYFEQAAVNDNDNGAHFVHHAIQRASNNAEEPGVVNSNEAKFFKSVLDSFCLKNNIKYKTIYRAALNITFSNNLLEKVAEHTDHDFFHRQLLVYLNDSDGDTVILDYEDNIFKSIPPEKYKGIMFDSIKHYHFFPKKNRWRSVMVITFI